LQPFTSQRPPDRQRPWTFLKESVWSMIGWAFLCLLEQLNELSVASDKLEYKEEFNQ
jgi:hypothetical protein